METKNIRYYLDLFWKSDRSGSILYKTSLYLMLSSLLNSGVGLIFWLFAAKLYSKYDVGITTAIISSIGFIVLISRLGLDQSIIRFLPDSENSGNLIGTSIVVTSVISMIVGGIYLLNLNTISPELQILESYSIIFLFFLLVNSINSQIGTAFIALRETRLYFIQTAISCSRIFLLFLLIITGPIGIFLSIGCASCIALAVSSLFIFRYCSTPNKFDLRYLKVTLNYSLSNYIANFFVNAPNLILPLIVLNILGSYQTANYFIAYSISSILLMIPFAIGTSMFVEGSYGLELRSSIKKSLTFMLFLLIPSTILFTLIGESLLKLFGETYVQALFVFRLMCLSSVLFALFQVWLSANKITKNSKNILTLSLSFFVSIIGLSILLMLLYGLDGLGYAWILSYGLSAIVGYVQLRGTLN